jgi:hypothetical protein
MQKARGNHCIKKISQVSVVHENCCKPILTIENKKKSRIRNCRNVNPSKPKLFQKYLIIQSYLKEHKKLLTYKDRPVSAV